jgi:hypothetical protein
MAFDEQGQAATYEDKIRVCERAYRILLDEVGFPPEPFSPYPKRAPLRGAQQQRNPLHALVSKLAHAKSGSRISLFLRPIMQASLFLFTLDGHGHRERWHA